MLTRCQDEMDMNKDALHLVSETIDCYPSMFNPKVTRFPKREVERLCKQIQTIPEIK